MNGASIGLLVAGGAVLLGAAGATIGALTLFNKVIPRQDQVRVNLDEMADMAKWEEYKKVIHPRKEWIMARPSEHLTIKSRDGLTLHGDYFPADETSDTVVIAHHGYTSMGMNDCPSICSFFLKKGVEDNGLGFNFEYKQDIVTEEEMEYLYYYLCRVLFRGIEDKNRTVGEILEMI